MTLSFNLIDEKWIPALAEGQEPTEVSLRYALTHAREITEILGESPPITVAIHRMLLAILHRALDAPKDREDWQKIWKAGTFDEHKIIVYLEKHRSAFDLFDAQKPFFQNATIQSKNPKSVENLFFQNNPTARHFGQHSGKVLLSHGAAAIGIIAMQTFDVCGYVAAENKEGKESANETHLMQTAIALMRGDNLFETLMLNFIRYDGENGEPFSFESQKDLPAWEREGPTRSEERLMRGYADWLTWQGRRLRLRANGNAEKMEVKIFDQMRGNWFPKSLEPKHYETMVAFRKNPRSTEASKPWLEVCFREDRALWRDSLTLFENVKPLEDGSRAESFRPKTVTWLSELTAAKVLSRDKALHVDFLGVTAVNKDCKFWRHERFVLPLLYLADTNASRNLFSELGRALRLAEDVEFILKQCSQKLATLLLSEHADLKNGRSPDKKKDVNPLAASFGIEAFYWSRLETPFKALMLGLPDDVREVMDGEDLISVFGEIEMRKWAATLRRCAEDALLNATRSLGMSARNLKAVTAAERLLQSLLGRKIDNEIKEKV